MKTEYKYSLYLNRTTDQIRTFLQDSSFPARQCKAQSQSQSNTNTNTNTNAIQIQRQFRIGTFLQDNSSPARQCRAQSNCFPQGRSTPDYTYKLLNTWIWMLLISSLKSRCICILAKSNACQRIWFKSDKADFWIITVPLPRIFPNCGCVSPVCSSRNWYGRNLDIVLVMDIMDIVDIVGMDIGYCGYCNGHGFCGIGYCGCGTSHWPFPLP